MSMSSMGMGSVIVNMRMLKKHVLHGEQIARNLNFQFQNALIARTSDFHHQSGHESAGMMNMSSMSMSTSMDSMSRVVRV